MTDPRQSPAARVRQEVKRLRQRASRFWHQKRHLAIGLIVAGLIAVAGAGLLAYELLKRPADVHNSQAAFVPRSHRTEPRRDVLPPRDLLDDGGGSLTLPP